TGQTPARAPPPPPPRSPGRRVPRGLVSASRQTCPPAAPPRTFPPRCPWLPSFSLPSSQKPAAARKGALVVPKPPGPRIRRTHPAPQGPDEAGRAVGSRRLRRRCAIRTQDGRARETLPPSSWAGVAASAGSRLRFRRGPARGWPTRPSAIPHGICPKGDALSLSKTVAETDRESADGRQTLSEPRIDTIVGGGIISS